MSSTTEVLKQNLVQETLAACAAMVKAMAVGSTISVVEVKCKALLEPLRWRLTNEGPALPAYLMRALPIIIREADGYLTRRARQDGGTPELHALLRDELWRRYADSPAPILAST